MSILKRYFKEGQIYFVTCVTYNREKHLIDNYHILDNAITQVVSAMKIEIIALSFLPDHFHLIINPKNEQLSSIIKKIKLKYSYQYRQKHNLYRKTLWQHRYWDHIIRDETDMNHHIDYIHYNPVKHGIVQKPYGWKFSSIHNYKDIYSDNWGVKEEVKFNGDFGE